MIIVAVQDDEMLKGMLVGLTSGIWRCVSVFPGSVWPKELGRRSNAIQSVIICLAAKFNTCWYIKPCPLHDPWNPKLCPEHETSKMYNVKLFNVFGSVTPAYVDNLQKTVQSSAALVCVLLLLPGWWPLLFTCLCGTGENQKGCSELFAARHYFILFLQELKSALRFDFYSREGTK